MMNNMMLFKSPLTIASNRRKCSPIILLVAIILFLSAYMVYWGTQKEGYHLDEMFSLMSIRGGGLNYPHRYDGFFNTWHVASELESTVGVTAENAFSGIGTYRSLHRTLLHIVYSLTPGEFSLWPSLILNIITLAGILIFIYLISRFFIANKYLALLPGLLWGLSSAAVNMVLFIRYCSFLTFFCTLLTYAVLTAVQDDFKKLRYPVVIALTTLFGTYIHQYFYVYAFFLSASVCFYLFYKMLITKKARSLITYITAVLGAIIINQIDTNAVVSVITTPPGNNSGGRIGEAVDNIVYGNAGWGDRIQAYFKILSTELFAGLSLIIVFFLCILFLVIIYANKRERTNSLSEEKADIAMPDLRLWVITGVTCLAYILMIARIAPYQEIRYAFNITPMIVVLFVSLGVNALCAIGFRRTVPIFIIAAVVYSSFFAGRVSGYSLYKGWSAIDETLSEYHNLPVVCISAAPHDQATFYWQLFDFDNNVLFATIDDVDYGAIGNQSFDDGALLFLHYSSDGKEMEIIMENEGLTQSKFIIGMVRHAVYLLG